MTKELGDLRKIALSLEEMTDINSDDISEKVGDLRRIAEALEKNAGINSEEIPSNLGDLRRIADAVDNIDLSGGGSAPTLVAKQTTGEGEAVSLPIGTFYLFSLDGEIWDTSNIPLILCNINNNRYLLSTSPEEANIYAMGSSSPVPSVFVGSVEEGPIKTDGITLLLDSPTPVEIEIKEFFYPEGEIVITESGEYDVSAYADAYVDIDGYTETTALVSISADDSLLFDPDNPYSIDFTYPGWNDRYQMLVILNDVCIISSDNPTFGEYLPLIVPTSGSVKIDLTLPSGVMLEEDPENPPINCSYTYNTITVTGSNASVYLKLLPSK